MKLPEPLRPFFSGAELLRRQHGIALGGWASGSAEKLPGDMIREEYLSPRRLTAGEANDALVGAGLKAAADRLPPSADLDQLRAVLDAACEDPVEPSEPVGCVNPAGIPLGEVRGALLESGLYRNPDESSEPVDLTALEKRVKAAGLTSSVSGAYGRLAVDWEPHVDAIIKRCETAEAEILQEAWHLKDGSYVLVREDEEPA